MKHSKAKFLFFPVLVLPFVIFAFWALGGGRGKAAPESENANGLDLNLPGADVSGQPENKLGYYEKAAGDSMRLTTLLRQDPYAFTPDADTGSPEAKVYDKIDEIHKALEQASDRAIHQPTIESSTSQEPQLGRPSPSTTRQADPEMQQVNGMLDKILAIQHPEQFVDTANRHREPQSLPVIIAGSATPDTTESGNHFYSLTESVENAPENRFIRAVTEGSQTLVSGATVKMRLEGAVVVAGQLIAKGSLIYGTADVQGQRLLVTVKGIRSGDVILPVGLSVYDLDGMEGLSIPGALTREVAKESAGSAVQQVGVSSLDPSLKMQVAGAGIEAAKNLVTKKTRLVRVTVKAGYHLLLKNQ